MRLRRLAAVPLAAAAVFGTAAAGFSAATAPQAVAPQAPTAFTSRALASRYSASAKAIAKAAKAAGRSGGTQLAGALAALRTRQVIFFDPRGRGLAGMVIGNLATATRVAILVPGSDTTLSTFFSRGPASPGGGAAALAAEARRLDPGARLAIIAWLGYPAPATLSPGVATSGDASAGARALRSLVTALNRHGDQIALLCHSYGSVVCGLAAPRLPAGTSRTSGCWGSASGRTRCRPGSARGRSPPGAVATAATCAPARSRSATSPASRWASLRR